MRQLILCLLLFVVLCRDGQEVVNVPKLFPGAQMEITACGLDMDNDRVPEIILLYAGGDIIKALMPHEFVEALGNGEEE